MSGKGRAPPAAEAFPVEAFAFGGNSHAGLTRAALKGIT
jgi:hypothetical protein